MAAAAAAGAAGRQYSESGIRGRKIELNTVEGGRGKWKQRAMEGSRGGVGVPCDTQLCPNSSKQACSVRIITRRSEVTETRLQEGSGRVKCKVKCCICGVKIMTGGKPGLMTSCFSHGMSLK